MPLPIKAQNSRRKHATQGAAAAERSQDSDHSDPDADPVAEEAEEVSDEEESTEEEASKYSKGDKVDVQCEGRWYAGVVTRVHWVNGNETVSCWHDSDQTRTNPMATSGDIRRTQDDSEDDETPFSVLIGAKRAKLI
jgi:hypothetical protein